MFLCFQNSVSSKDLLPAHENLDNIDFSVADKKNMLALIGGLHSVVLNCILDRSQHKYEIDPIYFFKCTLLASLCTIHWKIFLWKKKSLHYIL